MKIRRPENEERDLRDIFSISLLIYPTRNFIFRFLFTTHGFKVHPPACIYAVGQIRFLHRYKVESTDRIAFLNFLLRIDETAIFYRSIANSPFQSATHFAINNFVIC